MLNNLILTDNGLKKISEVAKYPKHYCLVSHSGDFFRINNVVENHYKGDIFDIGVMGDNIHTTQIKEDNQVLILPAHSDTGSLVFYPYVIWKSPSEIIKGDRVAIPKLNYQKFPVSPIIKILSKFSFFNKDIEEISPDYFRFLGYYFGSASVFPSHNSIIFNTSFNNDYCVLDMERLIKKYLSLKRKDIMILRGKKNLTIIVPFSSHKVQLFLEKYNANKFSHFSAEMLQNFELDIFREFLKGFVWTQIQYNKTNEFLSKDNKTSLVSYLPTRLYGDSLSSLLAIQWVLYHFDIYSILKKNEKYSQKWNMGEKRYYLKIMSYSIENFARLVEINPDPEALKNPYPYSFEEKPINDIRYIYIPITKFYRARNVTLLDYKFFSEKTPGAGIDQGIFLHNLIVK